MERELYAKRPGCDRQEFELQREHSNGRQLRRNGIHRQLQRNERGADKLLCQRSSLQMNCDDQF